MMMMALLLEEIIESKRRIEQENPLWFWELWAGYHWNVSAAYDLWLKSKVGEAITDPAHGLSTLENNGFAITVDIVT